MLPLFCVRINPLGRAVRGSGIRFVNRARFIAAATGLNQNSVRPAPVGSDPSSRFRQGLIADTVMPIALAGTGGARSRWMAARMRVNRAPPTAASAGWNVTARAWRTTRAPILMRRVRRPVGALQEDTGIAGRCMKLKPHLVPRHAFAGKTCPIDRLPAFLDMPFGGAALVVEPNDPVRLHR